jgi:hypothetical protein
LSYLSLIIFTGLIVGFLWVFIIIGIRRNWFIPFSSLLIVIILDVLVNTSSSFFALKHFVFQITNCCKWVGEEISFLVICYASELVYQLFIAQYCISKFIKPIFCQVDQHFAHLFFLVVVYKRYRKFAAHLQIKFKIINTN